MADDARLRREAAIWLARLRAPDGERDRAAFETWRGADAARAAAFARAEASWRASARLAHSPLARTSRLSKPWLARREVQFGGLALGGAVAAALLVILPQSGQTPPASGPPVASAVGQIRTVALPDGTRVTLDTDTALRVRFSARERRVELDHGRARFTVAADPGRRFVVAAGGLLVFDRGTVFDVRSRPQAVDIVLLTGAVEVRGPARALSRPVSLAAGEQVTIAAGTARPVVPQVMSAGPASWPTGLLSFERTPLADVVREANRYSATKLVLADPALADLRITGAFRATAPADLAAGLAALFALRTERRADGAILLWPGVPTAPTREGG